MSERTVYDAQGRINRLSVLCIDAYGVAVKNGFKGTVEEWLASLKPVKGVDYHTEEEKEEWIAEILSCTDERFEAVEAGLQEGSERLGTVESQIADLMYEPITVQFFTHNLGTREKGEYVNGYRLDWMLSKKPATLTVDGKERTPVKGGSANVSNVVLAYDHTFELVATDERGAEAKATTKVSFLNGVYYGAAEAPETADSAFILGLANKVLSGSRKRTVTVEAGEGQYIWYCLPSRLGQCTFKVGGFEGGFDLVSTMQFTNSFGYEEEYYIYRSANAGLGSTTVEVS